RSRQPQFLHSIDMRLRRVVQNCRRRWRQQRNSLVNKVRSCSEVGKCGGQDFPRPISTASVAPGADTAKAKQPKNPPPTWDRRGRVERASGTGGTHMVLTNVNHRPHPPFAEKETKRQETLSGAPPENHVDPLDSAPRKAPED